MASLPQPRPQSQRRSSRERSPQTAQSPARARSATSEDSQTIFVNVDDGYTDDQPSQQQTQLQAPIDKDSDPNINKCWICFSDATEDTPETSVWRDPCPCALVAHEECLLDWIADMEAPKNSRNQSLGAPKIECPQCKSEIKLARPRNYIVDAVRGLERAGAQSVTPAALSVLGATVWTSSLAWGMHSVYAVFGADDGFRILRPMLVDATRAPVEVYFGDPQEGARKLLNVVLYHLVHWRLYVGLPLITPVLVLSRTRWADSVLPVLPILFFATQNHVRDEGLDFRHWPPSASLAFAVLPYVRSAYNAYYEKVWAEKEKRWMKEIQPRNGQSENTGEPGEAALDEIMEDGEEAENVFELRIDGGLWDDHDEDPGQPQPDAQVNRAVAPPLRQPPLPDAEAGAQPPPNIADNRPAPQVRPPRQQREQAAGGERRLSFSASGIAETVIGALLFPTIAGMSGELLKLILPTSWTTPTGYTRLWGRTPAKGLLQEKWGRSLVGGCLFVVAKDAVMLYVRWKMAQMHRRRQVLDYDRKARR